MENIKLQMVLGKLDDTAFFRIQRYITKLHQFVTSSFINNHIPTSQ